MKTENKSRFEPSKEDKMFRALGCSNNLFRNAVNANRSLISFFDSGWDIKTKEEQYKLLVGASEELQTYLNYFLDSLKAVENHFDKE